MNSSFLLKKSGKNSKFIYYGKNMLRYLIPKFILRARLKYILESIEKREDKEYIYERVNYYNKLNQRIKLPNDSKTLGKHKLKGHKSVYFFDTYEYTRWYPPHLKWCYLFGDINYIPKVPSIVKSRPIKGENQNSIILNLDKVRHFCFVKDKKDFASKANIAIFRGETGGKIRRQQFINMYLGHPMCDIGDVAVDNPLYPTAPLLTLYQHLDYKFIMSLEGNDVASNLKWIMSSNSIAVTPRLTCETWFMEGKLIPNYHYIEIKDDYSDLIEKLNFYIDHPEEAQKIIDHAHEYVNQFRDKKREKLISLLVLQKYFHYTGQMDN